MIKTIGLLLLLAVAIVLGLALMKPDRFRLERRIGINAPPEKIYPLLNDFQRWGEWSPWEKLDPQLKRSHSGAASGVGAVYAWEGNDKVGQGRMEILSATPPTALAIQLDFIKPMQARNTAEFNLTPQGGATEVAWAMHGPSPFMAKVMQVFVSMDAMVGKDFETGLANLKAAAER